MRRALLFAAALALAAPAAAHAGGGGGITASYGGQAITGPDGKYGYIAVPARHDSVVQVFHDGLWVRWKTFKGAFAIPQAAWDGTKTGLSADGKTLVLAEIPDTYPTRADAADRGRRAEPEGPAPHQPARLLQRRRRSRPTAG